MNGTVASICISPTAGEAMQYVDNVRAIAGAGLEGDRYAAGEGSFNKGRKGRRQVTLINNIFFAGSGFTHVESRRNIAVKGVELMWLIGRDFQIGEAIFRGVTYCDPCLRPSKLARKNESFQRAFFDCGGLVAEVIQDGLVKVKDAVIPPPKGY